MKKEINGLRKLPQEWQDDFYNGVATVLALMQQFEKKAGPLMKLKPVWMAWENKKVKYSVWTIQTLLLLMAPWSVFFISVAIGLLLSGTAGLYAYKLKRIAMQTQDHLMVEYGKGVDRGLMYKIWKGEI